MYAVSQPQLQQGGAGVGSDQQQMQARLKQQQQLMQQAAMLQQQQQQQQGIYHPGLLAPIAQIEPIPSGNLPPGFDSSSCRSVYVGNIHMNVTESLLAEVFASIGPLEGCKLIRKDKSSYGFVDYFDHRSAANSILSLNGRHIFGQPIKVNWAYASGQREDTSGHYSIFVGDLSSEVTDATLFACFSVYPSCSDARVMWDQKSGRSRGFGFVSFRNQQDADNAINQMNGKALGSRQIRCNWATKTSSGNPSDDKQNVETQYTSNSANAVTASSGDAQAATGQTKPGAQTSGPESNPQYTTVYIGNLSSEVTQSELHRQFLQLGVGVIEDVRVQREKGFGFVRYRTHEEAALAIQLGNGKIICGKSIKCSWGSKPTPPGATSSLPPAAAQFQGVVAAPGLNQGYTAADILAYRQLNMSQAGAGQPLLPLSAQQGMGLGLGHGPMGMVGAAGNQSIYDNFQAGAGVPAAAAAAAAAAMRQQLMYYQ